MKSLVNIVDVISSYINVQKVGSNHRANCPFHQEKTPSFYIYDKNQNYHCFGCGATGDVIKFVQDYEKISFAEAVKKIAGLAGIDEPDFQGKIDDELKKTDDLYRQVCEQYKKDLLSNGEAMEYLVQKRGFSHDFVEKFNLGFSGTLSASSEITKKIGRDNLLRLGIVNRDNSDRYYKRLIIPIQDYRGYIIGIAGRLIVEMPGVPKYINSPQSKYFNKSNVLFLENRARDSIKEMGYAIIVEGYMDAMAMYSKGIENVVAVMGTALTESHMKSLKRYAKRILFIFDSDKAGKDAVIRSYKALDKTIKAAVCTLPDAKDPDEYLKKNGIDNFKDVLMNSTPIEEYVIDKLYEQFDVTTTSGRDGYLKSTRPILSKVFLAGELSHYSELAKKVGSVTDIDSKMIMKWVSGEDAIPSAEIRRENTEIQDNSTLKSQSKINYRREFEKKNPEDYILYIFLYRPNYRKEVRRIVDENRENMSEEMTAFFKDCNVKFLPDDSDRVFQEYFGKERISNHFKLIEENILGSEEKGELDRVLKDCERALVKRGREREIEQLDERIKKESDPKMRQKMIKSRMEIIFNLKKETY